MQVDDETEFCFFCFSGFPSSNTTSNRENYPFFMPGVVRFPPRNLVKILASCKIWNVAKNCAHKQSKKKQQLYIVLYRFKRCFFEELCIEIYVVVVFFEFLEFRIFSISISHFRSFLGFSPSHPTKGASQIPLENFGSARPSGAAWGGKGCPRCFGLKIDRYQVP